MEGGRAGRGGGGGGGGGLVEGPALRNMIAVHRAADIVQFGYTSHYFRISRPFIPYAPPLHSVCPAPSFRTPRPFIPYAPPSVTSPLSRAAAAAVAARADRCARAGDRPIRGGARSSAMMYGGGAARASPYRRLASARRPRHRDNRRAR